MVGTPSSPSAASAPASSRFRDDEPLTFGLWLIVFFKAVTALLLWGAFFLLLFAGREDPRDFFSELVFRTFRGNPPEMAVRFLINNTGFISHAMVIRVAI